MVNLSTLEHTQLSNENNIYISPCTDIYSLFLTDDIIDKIVEETNKYADKYLLEKEITAKSRSKAWKPTDANEMRQFFSIILTMGLNKVPHFHDYWSKKSIYRNEYICSLMGRDRFILLLKFWHFSDERNDTEDRLYKIRQILNMLNNRFRDILTPGKFIVIDESMIPWRGRLIFRQYLKNKSHKYGVKLYKLCTPERYTFKTIVYTGKEGNSREVNHGKNLVMKLIEGLENEGRVLVADNFYSSLDLVEELLEKKTFYCGTLRSNRRGLPKQFMSKKLKKGEVEGIMLPSGVKVIKWHDKRQVSMITSCKAHKASLVDTDLLTSEASALLNDWCRPMEDNSDDDMEELVAVNEEAITLTRIGLAFLPDFLTKTETDWFIEHDTDSNRILHDLLPTDNLNFNWTSVPTTFRG
ncbi:unnamed protein product [Arctia plantaginis]|uniref:PiggyBac transposable element-derived protein domain-containing protein n=1 Tax=Arctia plantaginis TaxID=874455 RepID=A0A8S0ZEL5_ARCPL|nr:unnamed protein product [Arctia plantaginis]